MIWGKNHINGRKLFVAFGAWLLSPRTVFLKFIYAVARISTSFNFVARQYSVSGICCGCCCCCSVTASSSVLSWSVAGWAPLAMEFPKQECWSGLPFSSPGDPPDPGMESTPPTSAGGFFTTEPPRKPRLDTLQSAHQSPGDGLLFWLLGVMLLRIFVCKCLRGHTLISLGQIPRNRISGSYGTPISNILRTNICVQVLTGTHSHFPWADP